MEITRNISTVEISFSGFYEGVSKSLNYIRENWLTLLTTLIVLAEIFVVYLFYGATITEGTLTIIGLIFGGTCGLVFAVSYRQLLQIRREYNKWILNRWACTFIFILLFVGIYSFFLNLRLFLVELPWLSILLVPFLLLIGFMQIDETDKKSDEYTGMSLIYSRSSLEKKNKRGGQNKQEEQDIESMKVHNKTLVMIIVILTINMASCVYEWQLTRRTAEETQWNPYLFCGVPAWTIAQGNNWWNIFGNYWGSLRFFMFENPIFHSILWGLIFWANIREEKKKQLTIINTWIIITDFVMLATTNYG